MCLFLCGVRVNCRLSAFLLFVYFWCLCTQPQTNKCLPSGSFQHQQQAQIRAVETGCVCVDGSATNSGTLVTMYDWLVVGILRPGNIQSHIRMGTNLWQSTLMVISLYCLLENRATIIMTQYPTQSHYPNKASQSLPYHTKLQATKWQVSIISSH